MSLKKLLHIIIECIFPRFCVGCGKIGTFLCYCCYETIEFTFFPTFNKSEYLESVTVCCQYSHISKQLIFQLKYQNISDISQILAAIIYYTVAIPKCKYYTYVPLHWRKQNIRGYNQSKLIAEHLSEITNTKLLHLLKKNSHTRSQMSTKTKKDRIQNTLNGYSYVPTASVRDKSSILIIDDVFTTGATLSACAQVLRNNGWKSVHGLCFAQRS